MRIIARLDIKNSNLIKSINFEGLKVLGNPNVFAKKYYEEGADELIFMDLVASLYNRNSLHDIIKKASENIFIPFTVGGGIRTIDDALKIFDSGADKIAVNTAAIKNPKLINNLAKRFGSQAIVVSIEAKKQNDMWEAYIESGREQTQQEDPGSGRQGRGSESRTGSQGRTTSTGQDGHGARETEVHPGARKASGSIGEGAPGKLQQGHGKDGCHREGSDNQRHALHLSIAHKQHSSTPAKHKNSTHQLVLNHQMLFLSPH